MSYTTPEPSEQDCQGPLHPKAVEGFELFNAHHFWHAHEALETAWLEETGEVRHLYRGILQIAVTYLHVERANYRGAIKVFKRSQRWLDSFPGHCRGIDLGQLRRDSAAVMAEVARLGPENLSQFDHGLLRPLVWLVEE
jgi:predicted metal-dependent hydrolase